MGGWVGGGVVGEWWKRELAVEMGGGSKKDGLGEILVKYGGMRMIGGVGYGCVAIIITVFLIVIMIVLMIVIMIVIMIVTIIVIMIVIMIVIWIVIWIVIMIVI